MNIKDLLENLSNEVLEEEGLVPGLDQEIDEVIEEAPVSVQEETPEEVISEMTDVAEELEEVADRADNALDDDRVHMVNELAVESLQALYLAIGQKYDIKTHLPSFESSADPVTQMRAISADCRKQAATVHQAIQNYSEERRSFTQWIGIDKLRIKRYSSLLTKAKNKFNQELRESDIPRIKLSRKEVYNSFARNGKFENDLAKALGVDSKFILGTIEELNSGLDDIMHEVQKMADDPNYTPKELSNLLTKKEGFNLLRNQQFSGGKVTASNNKLPELLDYSKSSVAMGRHFGGIFTNTYINKMKDDKLRELIKDTSYPFTPEKIKDLINMAEQLVTKLERSAVIKDLDKAFKEIKDNSDWTKRAKALRNHYVTAIDNLYRHGLWLVGLVTRLIGKVEN